MKPISLLTLLFLGGCSYTTYLSGADEHGGRVDLVTDLSHDSAVQKAKDHCQTYNLTARVIAYDQASSSLTFACQAPDAAPAGGR